MTVTTRSPTTVISSGAWLLVSNVFASDLLRASLTVSSGSSAFTVGGFGLAEAIGTDVVNSVTVRIQHYENQTNQNRVYVDLLDNGVVLAGGTQVPSRTAEGYDQFTLTGITNAQINALQLRVEGAKQGGGGSRSFNVNHVEIIIDHSAAVPPPAPTNLSATAVSSSRIDLTWTNAGTAESADLEVDGVIVTGSTSPYIHSGLLASTEHTYRVRGVNVAGAGAWSTLVTRSTLPPPNPPNNLAATTASSSQINVTWTQPGDATSVDLEIDGVVSTGATSPRAHTGLSPNTTHNYRVRSVNAGGPGAWSSLVSATTLPLPPSVPTNLVATAISSSRIDVTWTTPVDATSVDIEVNGSVTTGVTSPYTHSGLLASTTHSYRVRGVNSGGAGGWTSLVNQTTLPPPNPPANLTLTAVGPYQVDVTWTKPSDADTVDLEVDGVVLTNSTSPYSHTGLTSQSTHNYRARSVNAGGTGAWSNLASITTPAPIAPRTADAGSPSEATTTTYDAEGPSSPYDLTLDGGPPPDQAPYVIRVNGVYRTIAKYRMNGVDRTVASFRLNGSNLT